MIALESCTSDFGTITVSIRKSTNSILYDLDGRAQCEIDRNGISLAYYIHVLFGLLLQAGAKNILMIGCGGGTLATMLWRTGRSVEIVERDPASFDLAKRYFFLPPDIPCHVGDGEEFLQTDTNIYDAIVLDAFQGSTIPIAMRSERFYALVHRRLAPGGNVFTNILLENDWDDTAVNVAKVMSEFVPVVRILDTPGVSDRNAIAMSGEVGRLQVPKLITRPEVSAEQIETQIARMEFRRRTNGFWSRLFCW